MLLEVEERLKRNHSLEQISKAMKRECVGEVIHETIYQHIKADKQAGETLYTHLRINSRRRYRKCRKDAGRSRVPGRIGIEKRPASVANLTRYGDWELELIEGKKGSGYVLSLDERKTMTARLYKLETKEAKETAEGIVAAVSGLRVRTLIYDNRAELSRHEEVSNTLGAR